MKPNPPPFESYAELRSALLSHYDEHQRSLPWRGETDPYRILVSEVMLQQTRVETVQEYYEAWLGRFPDLDSLASADLDEVLQAWEGLGYYRRARNLHRVAQVVRERLSGALPSSYAQLRELPGVGEYTAGAVASIAFGEAVPAPDGNVRRVLARVFDEPTPKPAWLRGTAAGLVDPVRPGDWNQALMELGATVCTPRAPRCGGCPLAEWCLALKRGTQAERPAAVPRRAPRVETFVLAILHRAGRVLLERRPPDGLLGGMWAFPERQVANDTGFESAALAIADKMGAAVMGIPEPLPTCEHRFTHIHATYRPHLIDVARMNFAPATTPAAEVLWLAVMRPAEIALPVAQRRVLDSAREHLAGAVV
jgi:A/G-specific adenine glycosylase